MRHQQTRRKSRAIKKSRRKRSKRRSRKQKIIKFTPQQKNILRNYGFSDFDFRSMEGKDWESFGASNFDEYLRDWKGIIGASNIARGALGLTAIGLGGKALKDVYSAYKKRKKAGAPSGAPSEPGLYYGDQQTGYVRKTGT